MFTIHAVDGYIETLYLAVYADKVLLIDSGCMCDPPRIAKVMTRQLNRPMTQITLAVASHAHPDHAGGAHTLRKRHAIPVAAPREINRWYAGFFGAIQHKIDITLGYFVSWTLKYPFERLCFRRHLSMEHPLDDGDFLPGFEDWKVISTPGHTAHDIVLYHAETCTLYAADIILKIGTSYRPPFPVSMRSEMQESLKKIRDLKVSHLLMAHGGAEKINDFSAIIDIMLKELEKEVPPDLKRLEKLEGFSPVVRQYNQNRKKTQEYHMCGAH